MKEVRVVCPKCGNSIILKNYWSWIFHWFSNRKTKCAKCGDNAYVEIVMFEE